MNTSLVLLNLLLSLIILWGLCAIGFGQRMNLALFFTILFTVTILVWNYGFSRVDWLLAIGIILNLAVIFYSMNYAAKTSPSIVTNNPYKPPQVDKDE